MRIITNSRSTDEQTAIVSLSFVKWDTHIVIDTGLIHDLVPGRGPGRGKENDDTDGMKGHGRDRETSPEIGVGRKKDDTHPGTSLIGMELVIRLVFIPPHGTTCLLVLMTSGPIGENNERRLQQKECLMFGPCLLSDLLMRRN